MSMPYPVEFFDSTDNGVPRFNGNFGRIKDSNVIITDSGDLIVPGHIFVGPESLSFRLKLLTGFTSSTQGGSSSIAHELDFTRIFKVNASVFYSVNGFIMDEFTRYNGYQFSTRVTSTDVIIDNSSVNSSLILNKPLQVVIFYSKV